MLAIIVVSARVWHAVSPVRACSLVAIDITALINLLAAALLAPDRHADLVPATTSQPVIDVALVGRAAHVVHIILLAVTIIVAGRGEGITKIIILGAAYCTKIATKTGVHLIVILITT